MYLYINVKNIQLIAIQRTPHLTPDLLLSVVSACTVDVAVCVCLIADAQNNSACRRIAVVHITNPSKL